MTITFLDLLQPLLLILTTEFAKRLTPSSELAQFYWCPTWAKESTRMPRLCQLLFVFGLVRGSRNWFLLACLAGVFYNVKNHHLLRQKVHQRISVMKTNTGVFLVFRTKHEIKCQLHIWKHGVFVFITEIL